MLWKDWSLIRSRVTTEPDCGTFLKGVSVLVAVSVREAKYPIPGPLAESGEPRPVPAPAAPPWPAAPADGAPSTGAAGPGVAALGRGLAAVLT